MPQSHPIVAVTLLAGSLDPLRAFFNAAQNIPRVVILVSPT